MIRELVRDVASRVANAVANSRLREAAQEQARLQGVIAQISSEIGASLESSVAFNEFARLLSELVPLDRVTISNVDVSNQTSEVLYINDVENLIGVERTSHRVKDTPTGHSADIGETVVINNTTESRRFSKWGAAASGVVSAVTVSMGRDGEFARVFQISSTESEVYGPEQVSIIEQVANQISGAVANQQLYRRSLELAQERERSIRLESERARLASVNEAKNEFLTLLTYELKTPLTSIIAFADLLVRGGGNELSDRQAQHLGVIQRNAWHLDSLIQDLVDVSGIERGTIELFQQESDLAELVSGVLEGLEPSLNERGQTLKYVELEGKAQANLDRQRVIQIVSNLVSNASKYSPSDTTVTVTVGSTGSLAYVTIEDEGPGIPEDDIEMVFDLFHRVDNEMTRKVPGTGQGLYLVRQLVELHGGEVHIESRNGAGESTGTTVRVEFLS